VSSRVARHALYEGGFREFQDGEERR